MKLKLIWGSLFFLLLSLVGEQGLWRLYELKKVEKSLRGEIREISSKNGVLIEEIEKLQDRTYLERLIREERGYIGKGEMLLEMPKTN